jgi:Tol biopolymer transport system component
MNAPRHSEAELRAMLVDLYPTATPGYRDDILGRTASTRPRPGWTFLERWLPMTLTLRRPVLATPIWLLLGLLLVLGLLTAAALLPVLSRPTSLFSAGPAPMANGLIAFDQFNDIYVVDPAGGEPRDLIEDDAMDMAPAWSPNGTKIAFWRRVPESGVMVANADGSDPILVIQGAIEDQAAPYYAWSPDSTRLLTDGTDSDSTIRIVNVDGSASRDLDVGMPADFPTWRPDGRAILFRGWTENDVTGLYRVDVETGTVTGPLVTVDPSTPMFERQQGQPFFFGPTYSPDGSRILYNSTIDPLPGQDPEAWYYRLHMIDADGTHDHVVEDDAVARSQGWAAWSPDGSRYLSRVEPGSDRDLEYLVISSTDGTGVPIKSAGAAGGWDGYLWAPDGSRILAWDGSELSLSLIDPTDGSGTPLGLTAGRSASWQPVAS